MSRLMTDYSRVYYRVPVRYSAVMVHNGQSSGLLIIDLSVHGCAAEDHDGVLPGSEVQLFLQGLTSPVPILTAIGRWWQGARCGFEFVGLPPQTYEHLRCAVIDELARRHIVKGNAG
jgi:hypothetical protein